MLYIVKKKKKHRNCLHYGNRKLYTVKHIEML
nr:MAG TPA: hypothetical protein [Bacteriophage sp.]